jgi:isocitrate dehydrogenase kinase/phosphatase
MTSPAQRTEWQLDAMVAVLGQWPSFRSVLPKESQQRAIAHGLEFQSHHSYSLLFKERDITDGWYIVYSGQVCLYTSEPPKAPAKLPKNYRPDRSIETMLHSLFEKTFQFILFSIVDVRDISLLYRQWPAV